MRESFEVYFAESRRSRGVAKRPTFERRADGTYTDDHTQRHWWTWQQATRNERERWQLLYSAVNDLMAFIGYHGSANARGDHAQAVMDALHALDTADGPNNGA